MIQKLGNSQVSVLLQGESGTGKEVVARKLYGVRSKGQFVAVDCGSLPAALIESELFGHERGAFTGAHGSRVGLLQTADGGTAFFDEIGELPAEGQAKLLRVLQQQEIRPVGSDRSRKCSFRVIAATNRDLREEVRCGRFRLDLYYRLNVVTLEVPPLRSRTEDIPNLVNFFLRKAGSQLRVTSEVMDALMAHTWPGNVRELENCVLRLVALSSDLDLHIEDLQLHGFQAGSETSKQPALQPQGKAFAAVAGASITKTASGVSLRSMERSTIDRALTDTGNLGDAAKVLGISRTTLYRKRRHLSAESAAKIVPGV